MTNGIIRLSGAIDAAPETLAPGEEVWRKQTGDLLDKLYQRRLRQGNDDFVICDLIETYVQFVAPAEGHQLMCEAASVRSLPELKNVLTAEKVKALTDLGFEVPGDSQNFSINIEFDGPSDLAATARFVARMLKSVYGVKDFTQSSNTVNMDD